MDGPLFDLASLRADTPGCARTIHLNSAGSALMPKPVSRAVIDHLQLESEIGGYEAADQNLAALDSAYASIAQLVGGKPHEIAFAENATRAWDIVFYGLPLQPGDRIITSENDYDSNFLAYLQRARHTGAVVELAPNKANGDIDLDALDAMLDERVKLISISHVPSSNGIINPVVEIGALARKHGILYLVDACQSIGQLPIDVRAIGCSFLTAAGRKFLRGPRGTGFLWVDENIVQSIEPAFLDFHSAAWIADDSYEIRSDAKRFESWECYVAGRIGLGVAADYALTLGLDKINARLDHLAQYLRQRIAAIPGAEISDRGEQQSAIVTFSIARWHPERLKALLHQNNIAVTVAACQSSRLTMLPRGYHDGVLRASVHYYNSEQEIDTLTNLLARLGNGSD